ncbi:hypothetical protein [Tropicimonas sp. TH_r6]|uniref:hypothetical protein n=1 Tax=Tropicimonas sp. TH_r6 TaxID=3082085 RepID=UPI003985721D
MSQHADIRLPKIKETHYFSHSDRRERGPEWYRGQFPDRAATLTGEIDPEYMYSPCAPWRIAEETSAKKIVFILRNPIRRAYSQYLMSVRRGYEPLSFREALLAEQDRLSGEDASFAYDNWSYSARSNYTVQIERFLREIKKVEPLFLLSDTLTSDIETSGYNQFCQFVGTSPRPELLQQGIQSNVASQPRFVRLRDFIYANKGRSDLRRAVTGLLPGSVKAGIFKMIDGLNQQPITENDETALVDLPEALLENMARDAERCQILTGLDLSPWMADLEALQRGA